MGVNRHGSLELHLQKWFPNDTFVKHADMQWKTSTNLHTMRTMAVGYTLKSWRFCQTCTYSVGQKKNLHAMWAGTVCFISNSCSGMKFLQGSVCSDGEATNLHAMWPVGRSFCRCMAGCKRATGEWFCYAVNFMQKLIQTRMDITGLARRVLNVQVPIAASSKQHWHHLEKMVFVRARVKQLLPLYMYIYTVWGVRGVSLCVQMFTRIED